MVFLYTARVTFELVKVAKVEVCLGFVENLNLDKRLFAELPP